MYIASSSPVPGQTFEISTSNAVICCDSIVVANNAITTTPELLHMLASLWESSKHGIRKSRIME